MQIKNRQQLLVIVAIAAVSLLAADKVIITPLTGFWKSRSEAIDQLHKDIARGKGLQDRQAALHSRWEHMKSNTLPADAAAAEQQVLKSLDRWAQESRVIINSISPQPKKDNDDYSTLEFHVDAAGNLGTITRFLYEIERDPMALKLDSVELSARDSDGQVMNLGLQLSGLLLVTQQAR